MPTQRVVATYSDESNVVNMAEARSDADEDANKRHHASGECYLFEGGPMRGGDLVVI